MQSSPPSDRAAILRWRPRGRRVPCRRFPPPAPDAARKPARPHGNPEDKQRYPVHPAGRDHGARDARRLRVSRARHRAQEEPGQRAGEDPRRLQRVDDRVLLHRLLGRLRRQLLHRGRGARGAQRLRAGEVLLPAHLRCRDPGDRAKQRPERALVATAPPLEPGAGSSSREGARSSTTGARSTTSGSNSTRRA